MIVVGSARRLSATSKTSNYINGLAAFRRLVGCCRQGTDKQGKKSSMKSKVVGCRPLFPYGGRLSPTSNRPRGRPATERSKIAARNSRKISADISAGEFRGRCGWNSSPAR